MARLKEIAKILYLAVVAYIPISIFRFGRKHAVSIGCPESGDCYVPGSAYFFFGSVISFLCCCSLAAGSVEGLERRVGLAE